jgi:hypothetical protein
MGGPPPVGDLPEAQRLGGGRGDRGVQHGLGQFEGAAARMAPEQPDQAGLAPGQLPVADALHRHAQDRGDPSDRFPPAHREYPGGARAEIAE